VQQLARDPQQLAISHNLGGQRAEYKLAITCQIIALLFLAVIGFAIIGFFMLYTGSTFLLPLVLGGVGLFIVILLGIVSLYRKRNMRILVYEQGFVYIGQKDNMRVIRWDQIACVWHKVTVSTSTSRNADGTSSTSTSYSHSYTIECFDKTTLVLHETFARLQEIGKIIERESARYLLPNAQRAFHHGQPLSFGPLSINMTGITAHRGAFLPWQEVKDVIIKENYGNVAIRKKGKWLNWASYKLEQIPNVVVFQTLAKSMIGR